MPSYASSTVCVPSTRPGVALPRGLGPILKASQGFIAYYVVRFGEEGGGSITLFETQQAAQDAHQKALAWIKTNLADLTEGEPEVISGEVMASVTGQGASGTRATAA